MFIYTIEKKFNVMRKLLTLFFLFSTAVAVAQDTSIVQWIREPGETADNDYTLHLKARINKNWWLYSDNATIAIATPFLTIKAGTAVLTERLPQRSTTTAIFDPAFSASIKGFQGEAKFAQDLRAIT
jgi:hypothetical protein